MSDSFPIEALKAQAVAARNYTLASIEKHKAKGYNLCDTIHCQVYGGYDTSLKNVIAAVDATKGNLLLSGTVLVNAFYSASDGGYTEACENVWLQVISYLKAKKDDYDGYDINYLWNKTYTNSDINNLFKLKLPTNDTFVKIDLSTITKFDSGRIKNISLIFKKPIGTYYTLSYGKESARTFLYFKSSLYNVSYDAATKTYNFKGKGIGHGVGMSQIGAKNRAAAGQKFGTILKFYYDGTTLLNALPKVIFNTQGGSAVTSKTADYNSVITAPVAPTKTGYTFGGWYKEAVCINAWNFTTNKVTANTTLYAKWTVVATGILTNLKAVSSSYNSINISWSGVTGVSGYQIYRATSSTGTYTLISTTTAIRYNNTGLTTNRIYYYKVRAYRMVGTVKVYSGYSTTINSKPILSTPASIKSISSSYNSINFSWGEVTGASGYEIYRATSSTGIYTLVSKTTATRYNNTGLTTNRIYYYKVRAYRMVGTVKIYSGFSTVKSLKPVPSAPTSVKAVSSSYNSINISWNGVVGASGYEVYRATSSTGPYTLVSRTTATRYNNTGLTTNRTYYYKVREYRIVGTVKEYSYFLTVVSAKPVPSTPINAKATRIGCKSIKLTWSSVTGANGYEVYRSISSTGTYILLTRTTYLYYANSGLITGKTYYYKMRSYRTVGTIRVYSNWTAVVYA